MTTSGYPPLPEPFAQALGEAAQTMAMAYRLVSDAVHRATPSAAPAGVLPRRPRAAG